MKKMVVYSHDTYGLGNITRMLAICRHLIDVIPDLSILLVTGSPVIHRLRLPESLDYIKLPCLTRTGRGEYTTKYLSASIEDAIRLRSDLILATVANFKPDLLMVDKKPVGVKGELAATLEYLQAKLPETRQVLILRDILDSPEAITSNWERNGHYDAIKKYYDLVLVLGEQEIFDPRNEYHFPPSVIDQTLFCGYLRKEAEPNSREATRNLLSVGNEEKLVLVTPGGGQDGYQVIETYLAGLSSLPHAIKSLVVCGPEMPNLQQAKLHHMALNDRSVIFYEFTGEMVSLMAASDVVIAMGGYNTICEILSLKKCAIVVPRVRPTEEQWIRARQMSHLGLFKSIHPDELTPERLIGNLTEYLESDCRATSSRPVNLNALPVVADRVKALLNHNGEARA
ncbi:MAG: glycosyltransferase [Acidobacteria bacterium]|nr:glycosyltransferase [Acidobacteriota bacterium]